MTTLSYICIILGAWELSRLFIKIVELMEGDNHDVC